MNAQALPPEMGARVLRNEPMSKHTSWHVGGPADLFFKPHDVADLTAFLRTIEPATPILWVGLGSNLLVRDAGIRGAVIETHGAFSELERINESDVWSGAGVACAKLAKQCVKWGLGPAEFFAGIPGTLGGALAMNAGAFGGETWRHVVSAATIDRAGVRRERDAGEFTVGYRHVSGPANEWFLGAKLRFEPRPGVSGEDIRLLLARRKATQPIGEWSCGSVFTNPPGDHAARLIESAGLKGHRIGGARVSEMHANFIVNDGSASAADIESLIRHVMAEVARVHGVTLTTEVRIVGEMQGLEPGAGGSGQKEEGNSGSQIVAGAPQASSRASAAPSPSSRIANPRDFGRVAVLMGGTSSEREVSLDSGRNCLEALLRQGVDAYAVDGIPALVAELMAQRCARVFNILHGHHGGGEDGVLQGLLDSFGIPYTGSGVLGSALSMDKIRTKQVWLSLGLPTPRYRRLSRTDAVESAASALGLPVIVKPACEGSSVGVSRVFSAADLPQAVALAARYEGELLMEQMIEGEEFTVGILGKEALPTIRIVPAGEYYDYHAKYVAEDTKYICPGLQGAAENEMRALALEAFLAAGCSGWGRVDVMRDRSGANFLLEVNTAPGMTSHSLVPKAAGVRGIQFDELVWRVLETSFDRAPAGGRNP